MQGKHYRSARSLDKSRGSALTLWRCKLMTNHGGGSMGQLRTLLNHQDRALGRGRFARIRARKGTPFWRIMRESTLGNLYHAYHVTKGWRQRAVSWQTIRDAQREGPLDKFWQALRAFWRSQQIGRPRYGAR